MSTGRDQKKNVESHRKIVNLTERVRVREQASGKIKTTDHPNTKELDMIRTPRRSMGPQGAFYSVTAHEKLEKKKHQDAPHNDDTKKKVPDAIITTDGHNDPDNVCALASLKPSFRTQCREALPTARREKARQQHQPHHASLNHVRQLSERQRKRKE